MFLNTCPFDAVYQIMCIAYADSQKYANFISANLKSKLFFEMIHNSLRDGITVQTYRKRGLVLLEIPEFKSQAEAASKSSRIITIDCNTAVYSIIRHIFRDLPSIHQLLNCEHCSFQNERERLSITVNMDNYHIKELQSVVAEAVGRLTCSCSEGNSRNNWAEHVWIETCIQSFRDFPVTIFFIFPLYF